MPSRTRLPASFATSLLATCIASIAQTAPPTVLPTVRAESLPEEPSGKDSVRAPTTAIGKGRQSVRDVPQSLTVLTEKLLDDRNLDTLKDALKASSGVSFLAAEGGEEDIRLRGFSLQASGDIFIDGLRDPAFYERDAFDWDRLEVLRGSASMLFGRGSTGGAVNQVSKRPTLFAWNELAVALGDGRSRRGTADLNVVLGEASALRVNAVAQDGDRAGLRTHKHGLAPTLRLGIGERHGFTLGAYHLANDNGIHYGLPWLTPGAGSGNFLWPTDPENYYGLKSDHNRTGTTQLRAGHTLRIGAGPGGSWRDADGARWHGEWTTQLRAARYWRDQRASAIRFAPAAQQPDGLAVNADRFSPGTVLTRGTNNKLMDLDMTLVQSDVVLEGRAFGLAHRIAAGADLADERFEALQALPPAGTTIPKPTTTVGTPDDGAEVDESRRTESPNRRFKARSAGLYAQDLLALNEHWKLLAGLRVDRIEGRYTTVVAQGAATNPCSVAAGTVLERADTLWSRRFGVIWQPSATLSWHASYGTSFNTSGDTYQYDAGSSRTPPESSENIELGGRWEAAGGRLSTRWALFKSTKRNERNRDADSVNACNYVLSGQRHAAGIELDVAGRITRDWEVFASWSFIPEAEVDASSGAAGTEAVGSRPGLTPRHSGSLWSTVKLDSRWRLGAGLNARSRDKPAGLAANSTLSAPGYATVDLLAEYSQQRFTLKANLANLADRHVAETLYRGHYVPAKPRTFTVTAAWKFQ
jgi:catecholate siderophore receptor